MPVLPIRPARDWRVSGGSIEVSNKEMVRFASPWPAKLRELEMHKGLLINHSELSKEQIEVLVTNVHVLHSKKGFFFKTEHSETFSMITRITEKESAAFTRAGTPPKMKGYRKTIPQRTNGHTGKKKAAAAPVVTVAGLAPKPILVLVVKQREGGVPYIDWTNVEQFNNEEETQEFLKQCASDTQILQARIYTFSHRLVKQVSWGEV